MAALKRDTRINLLPQKGLEGTTTGRVLYWLLGTFRVIVILIEVIVMIAFFSRFWLDSKNSNLTELINQKQSIIMASETSETEFRDIQKRLEVYSKLTSGDLKKSEVLTELTKYIPSDITLSSVSVNKNVLGLGATSPSERSIQQFIVNLDSSELFETVSLQSIKPGTRNQAFLEFNLSIKIRGNN